MKIRVVEAELYHADRQRDRQASKQASKQASMEADMMELIVALCNFPNAPNDTWRWPVAGLSAYLLLPTGRSAHLYRH